MGMIKDPQPWTEMNHSHAVFRCLTYTPVASLYFCVSNIVSLDNGMTGGVLTYFRTTKDLQPWNG